MAVGEAVGLVGLGDGGGGTAAGAQSGYSWQSALYIVTCRCAPSPGPRRQWQSHTSARPPPSRSPTAAPHAAATLPAFLFFAVSGSLCNIVQLALDRLLLEALQKLAADADHEPFWWEPTACWTVSYTLSISLRHWSHSYFVFGRHADHWCCALAKTYLTYFSTILASTALNLALVSTLKQSHDIALAITAGFSVVWSYFALRCTWKFGDDGHSGARHTAIHSQSSMSSCVDDAGGCGSCSGSAASSASPPPRSKRGRRSRHSDEEAGGGGSSEEGSEEEDDEDEEESEDGSCGSPSSPQLNASSCSAASCGGLGAPPSQPPPLPPAAAASSSSGGCGTPVTPQPPSGSTRSGRPPGGAAPGRRGCQSCACAVPARGEIELLVGHRIQAYTLIY